MSKATQLAFNGGEFTEFMDSRVDVAKYGKGCRTLENMDVMPYGAAVSRLGTKFGGEVHDSTKHTRLIPFVFSDSTTFHIEISKDHFRFWKNGELVESSPGVPYILESGSWQAFPIVDNEEEIYDVQFEQINDVVTMVSPRNIFELIRNADDDWDLYLKDFNHGSGLPMGGVEDDTDIRTSVGADVENGYVNLTATPNNLFTQDHVSDSIEINERNITDAGIDVFAGANVTFYAHGAWNVTTQGTGSYLFYINTNEFVFLQGIKRYGDYDIVGTERNRSITGFASRPTHVTIVVQAAPAPTGTARITYTTDAEFKKSRYTIQSVSSPTQAYARVDIPTLSGSTIADSSGAGHYRTAAFSKIKGYPTSVCLYKNRLCFARNDIYLSASGDYGNFTANTLADGPFVIPLRKSGSPMVKWMQNLRELRVGMTSDEAVITQENVAEGFSYKNYNARFDTSYGSIGIKPESLNGSLLFITNDAETLRKQVVTGVENYYDANSVTMLADHILDSGVRQTANQRQPYPTLFAVRNDGQMAVLLYEESQGISAWSRYITDGKYRSVSVVPTPKSDDEAAFIVERVIDGVTKQYVEFRPTDTKHSLRDREYSDIWYVDCGIEVTGTAMATVTGLDHLEGKAVAVLADGIKQANKTVVAGEITLDAPADKAIVGLPYSYTLEPMMLNSAEVMGQSKQIAAAIVYLWRSGEGFVSVNGGLESRLKTDTDFTGAGLHDGSSGKINVDADWSRETSLTLRGESPLPLNVQSITLEFAIGRK